MVIMILVQDRFYWTRVEKWLKQRHAEICPDYRGNFRVSGYEWRTLHFNEFTRQSTVKILAAYREEEPTSLCFMQQAHCLAVPCNTSNNYYFYRSYLNLS